MRSQSNKTNERDNRETSKEGGVKAAVRSGDRTLPHPKYWWAMPVIFLSSYLQGAVQFAGLLADARDTKTTPDSPKNSVRKNASPNRVGP